MFVFLNNFYFKGNSAIYWFNISMKLYVMHRLLGNGGFDLFFLFASTSFWLWMYVFLLFWKSWKAQYKPMIGISHILYPRGRAALQPITISLSLMYRSAINLSLIDEMVFEHCNLYSQNTPLINNFGSIWKFCPPSFWHHD